MFSDYISYISRPPYLIPEKVIGFDLGTQETSYTERDACLYAASVGASKDPMNRADLNFTWEASKKFKVLPTFGVTIGSGGTIEKLAKCPGMPEFNKMMLLHGEESMTFHSAFPSS